jgi:hypothetical protein
MDINVNTKIVDHDNYNYGQSSLIKPPAQKSDALAIKTTRFVIDSRDRDKDKFPSASLYEINFDEDIPDVICAEICQANVPLSSYLININCNTFEFIFNNSNYTCVVEVGNYTNTTFADALRNALNTAVSSNVFTVIYDDMKDNYIFACTAPFSFIFTDVKKYIYQIIGFSKKEYTSTSNLSDPIYSHKLQAEFRKNFEISDYIVLCIESFNVNTSVNNNINKSFAIFCDKFTHNNLNISEKIRKCFNPPIAKLAKLKLVFKDYYGNIYDFQNHEHRIEINFESFKNCRRYTLTDLS